MNRITELRKEAGITQAELAQKIGVNPVTMSRYETGERNPKIDKLIKIANIFSVSLDYINGVSNSRTGLSEHWDQLADVINSQKTNYDISKISTEGELIADFRKLNPAGQKEASKQVRNLTKISDYTK